jgi:DNA-binding NarL/FixJ family response regulator
MYSCRPRRSVIGVMSSVSLGPSRTQLRRSTPEHQARNRSRESGIHVLLADDRRASSYVVWASLSGLRGIRGISTGESVEEVLSLAAQCVPDVCMVSVAFGSGEGFSLAHRLKHHARHFVLIYADAVNARVAGAAMIAGADGVFESGTPADALAEMIGRVVTGEQVFPPLLADPFYELADLVPERDRRIVAMLLERAHPDDVAELLGISAHSLTLRHRAIIEGLDAAYAAGPQPLRHT